MASTTATSKLNGRVAAIHLGHMNGNGVVNVGGNGINGSGIVGGGVGVNSSSTNIGLGNPLNGSITSGGSVSSESSLTFDGLPKSFISAMRTLFDIMADKRTGHVRFADIEQRWQEGSDGMPLGVIDSLRKVTPPNGQLSFDRFCDGLKICLLRNQAESKMMANRKFINESMAPPHILKARPPSAPLLDLSPSHQPPPPLPPAKIASWQQQVGSNVNNHVNNPTNANTNNTATVRPNNATMTAHRTLSMPQLSPEREAAAENKQQQQVHNIYQMGPPKPPRAMRLSAPAVPERMDRAEIRNALQNWQLGMLEGKNKAAGKIDYRTSPSFPRSTGDGQSDNLSLSQGSNPSVYVKKTVVRRREPRRHTLQNGIDHSMLKRLKQIEQEKDVLLQGLATVDKARDWYLKQIAAVQEKIKYLGRTGSTMDHWSDAQQERLDLQRARILEVNRHLMTLYEGDGFPMHMNLALHSGLQHYQTAPDIVARLKQQNQRLSEEMVKKNERVAALEREKAALIRDTIQLQQRVRNNAVSGVSGTIGDNLF